MDWGGGTDSMLAEHDAPLLDMKFSDALLLVFFNLMLFSGCVSAQTGFGYLDDLGAACMVLAAIVKLAGDRSRRELSVSHWGIAAAFGLVCFAFIGLVGNAVWNVQSSVRPVLVDLLTCVKFPATLIGALYVLDGCSHDFVRLAETEVRVIVTALFCLAVLNLFVDFGMGGDFRYGLRSFVFLCGHQTALTAMGVCLTIVLLRDARRNLPWIVLSLLIVASGLRAKGLVFCAMVIVLLFVLRGGRKLNAVHIILCALLALVIGWDQYTSQFQSDGYARTELARAAFEVAADHFPIGTGFGTFGSNVSGELAYYSPLYYEYDLATVWGLWPGESSFLSDTFWPTILGQFGYLGLFVFVALIGSLFVICYRRAGVRRIVTICAFGYLLISSTSESAFFHPLAVSIAFSLALIIREKR